jgi:hypothetical protein
LNELSVVLREGRAEKPPVPPHVHRSFTR